MGLLQASSPFELARSSAIPSWLWWNLLSLDAPAVAIIWALVFARAYQVRLSIADIVCLSCTVWVIYTSDRLMDGWRAKNRSTLQERHHFCSRHRRLLVFLLAVAITAGLWAAARYLPPAELIAGIKLAVVIFTYMVVVHLGDGWLPWLLPKEAAVGVLFTAGATLPVWSQGTVFSWNVWASFALFSMLCSLNCLAIERWESDEQPSSSGRHLALKWADLPLIWMAVILAVLAMLVLLAGPAEGSKGELWGISSAALLIIAINLHRNRFSSAALRVLADAALIVSGLIVLITGLKWS